MIARIYAAPLVVAASTGAWPLDLEPFQFTAELIDVDTGQRLEAAFVAHEENRYDPPVKFFRSSPFYDCLRETAVALTASPATLVLPAKSVAATEMMFGERLVGALAYRPGYCLAHAPAWNRAFFTVAGRDGVKDGVTSSYSPRERHATLRTRRDTGPPELRMKYLEYATRFLQKCPASPDDVFDAEARVIAQRMRAEIRSIRERLATPLSPGGRGFAILYPTEDARAIDWDRANRACAPDTADCSSIRADLALAEGAGPRPLKLLRLICRDPANCDLDRRYTDGKTALYQYIDAADHERVALLLAAGADPNVEREPGGPAGIDALLASALATRPERIPPALLTVRALVGDGRATLSPKTAERLRASPGPEPANLDAQIREQYLEIFRLAAALPARAPVAVVCGPLPQPGQILPF